MYAIYNNHTYKYIESRKLLIASDERRPEITFLKAKDHYYKTLAENDQKYLSDIFDIEFIVEYSCGYNISVRWDINYKENIFFKNSLRLNFKQGCIPGWISYGDNFCYKYIPLDEIDKFIVKYTYKRKDFIDLVDNIYIKEVFLSQKAFKALFYEYLQYF